MIANSTKTIRGVSMLTLLIGPDWVTNREQILRSVSEDVKMARGNRVLIVPELISHDMERRLCFAAGDTCSRFAEVVSFTRLVKRVSEYDRKPVRPCLDKGGRLVAMANVTKQLHSKLKAYAAVETKPEFLSGLVDVIDEFKRCCVTSEDLQNAAKNSEGSLAQKLEELSLILECYDSICARGKCDPRDQISWLLDELEISTYGEDHVFYIDGFPDFTRQNLNIIDHLIQVSECVTVSITADEVGSNAMAFAKAGETAAELIKLAKRKGVAYKLVYVQPRTNPTSVVRDLVFQGDVGDAKCDALEVSQTNSVYQECKLILERVIELIHKGARYRDINIACANLEMYRSYLEMLFRKGNIPLYISGTEDILDQPAIKTLFAALEAVLSGFDAPEMLQYVKSMLSPLNSDTCDLIENYVLLWGIRGKSWESPWTNHPVGLGEKWNDTMYSCLNNLEATRKTIIKPLLQLKAGLHNARTMGDMVKTVFTFLEQLHYSERLSRFAEELDADGCGREAQILNQLWDVIVSALEQLYDILGETAWEPENFLRLLKLLISQYDVGTIPPVLDSVSVGSMDVMRCQECKYLIVLGAEDGALPGYTGSAGVLNDKERIALRKLGLPLTGGAMDGLLAEFADIYGVFSSASDSVFICCSGEPSFVFKRLASIGNVINKDSDELIGPAMVNAWDAASLLLRMGVSGDQNSIGIHDAFSEIVKHKSHALGRINDDNIRNLYGTELNLSASRIDKLAQCRMAYFLQYGLSAKERKAAEIDPAEFGSYVHSVLEETVRTVMLHGGIKKTPLDVMVSIAQKASDIYIEERFSELDSDRIKYLFRRNWEELVQIIYELWEELQASEFEPVGLEVAFGDGCEVPAISVSGKRMAAKLRGFVDRVDLWQTENNNYFRVVDYKTGKRVFDYCDILNGYGLQMLLYLFTLQDSAADLVGENAIPAGVQYFPARVPLISADGFLSDEEAQKERRKLWKRKGLLLSDERVLAAMENTDVLVRMPYTRKKDGSICGDLADYQQFAKLKKYLYIKLGKMVDEIASGNVDPNPYTRGTSHNACTYCPYGAICHENSVEGRRNYQAISESEFWTSVDEEVDNSGK